MIALIVYLNITLLVVFVVGIVTATGWYLLFLFNYAKKVEHTVAKCVVSFGAGAAYWGACFLIFGVT